MQGTKVSESMTITRAYYDEFKTPEDAKLAVHITSYLGEVPEPTWQYKDEGRLAFSVFRRVLDMTSVIANFKKLCTLQALYIE